MSPRANHRDRLLRGALTCLQEHGYARTTARDIAAAAGVSLGSIGYHFGSVDALLVEAVGEGFRDWTRLALRRLDHDPTATPLERLQSSLDAMFATIEANRPVLVAFVEALSLAARKPELRDQLLALYAEARTAYVTILRAELGTLEVDDPALDTLAALLIALLDGLALQWLLDPSLPPDGARITAALRSLAAPGPAGA